MPLKQTCRLVSRVALLLGLGAACDPADYATDGIAAVSVVETGLVIRVPVCDYGIGVLDLFTKGKSLTVYGEPTSLRSPRVVVVLITADTLETRDFSPGELVRGHQDDYVISEVKSIRLVQLMSDSGTVAFGPDEVGSVGSREVVRGFARSQSIEEADPSDQELLSEACGSLDR